MGGVGRGRKEEVGRAVHGNKQVLRGKTSTRSHSCSLCLSRHWFRASVYLGLLRWFLGSGRFQAWTRAGRSDLWSVGVFRRMLAWASFPTLGCMQTRQNRAVFTESFVCIFFNDYMILKYSNVILFKRPSVSPPTAPLLHTLYSTLEYKWAYSSLPFFFCPSLPPSILFIIILFPHSHNSWAVLSHTRLLRISEDVDYDDNSNRVLNELFLFWRFFFFSLYRFFQFCFSKKYQKNWEKKRCKVLFLNYV